MGKYRNLQKYVSDYFKGKTKKELEEELFPDNPDLFCEIAFYRKYGVPKVYKNACKKYKVNDKLFLFESNLAKQYTGNPRYIYERMLELFPDFTYVWSYNEDPSIIPGNPIIVKRGSDQFYEYLAQAGCVINNTVFPIWQLRKETQYLQTWHGTPYKRMHCDIILESYTHPQPHFYVKSKGWSALLSPNKFSSEKFKSCFRYSGKIVEYGYPANDIFYNKDRYDSKRMEIRQKLRISEDELVYLYAPTWRNTGNFVGNMMFKFDLLFDPQKFMDNAPDNSVLLIRTHHMSEATEALKNLEGKVIDVSGWDDAIELMCAADILISDYSSIVFDWYCSKKPVIYYVPDLEEYETKIRGAYFDIREINCGILCRSEEELYDNLDVRDAPFYEEFYEEFCSLHDGKSSDRVINYLLGKNEDSEGIVKKIYKKIMK